MKKQQKLLATRNIVKITNTNLKVHKTHKSFSAKNSTEVLQNAQDAKIISTVHKKKELKKRKAAKMLEKWQLAPITFPFEQNCDMSDKPLVISCKVANTGIRIMKIHVDTGSSIDLIYEQCFRKLPECIKTELKATAISLPGFAGESAWPMGQLSLKIELHDETDIKLTRQAQLDFYVIRSASRYNMLLGRSALRKLGIVPSTIKIGNELDEEIRKKIIHLLVAYMDVFAWCEQDMTEVPREIGKHRLNVNPALKPIVQKRRGMARDRMKWLCGEVTKLVKADFKDINKACPKDNYLLPEIDLKVESLHAYPYKCFLDAAKEYHQIPMAQEDENKTAFHT
ncbi:uncharacterized protein [Rutidosis leptorrhynchoides]|uniref:uncharacterized protein n=1 Tax=Rutidosis leptorrhynchoides TaxID=125765 RepID=UPI003A98E139